MCKDDIMKEIALQAGITQTDTMQIVNAFLAVIKRRVSAGDVVKITDFGTFKVRKRKPIIARNLKGVANSKKKKPAPIFIPEGKIPVFKASKKFLKAAA